MSLTTSYLYLPLFHSILDARGQLLLPFIVAIAISVLALLLPAQRGDREKLSAYECGFEPFGDSRTTFDVHFYLVALLFIIFDLEIGLLLPWVFNLATLSPFGLWVGFTFFTLLTLGLVIDWRAVTRWVEDQAAAFQELGV